MSEPSVFPDLAALLAGLASVLRDKGAGSEAVAVLDRTPNPYASTFASEIVTCRLAGANECRLFCKYGAGPREEVYGHKGGVAYEAAVHCQVLQPLQVGPPRFYGAYNDRETGITWLIRDYLDPGELLYRKPAALALAARWIARFHNASAARLARTPLPFLKVYDADYYLGWARRTRGFAGSLHQRFTWLECLCERFGEVVANLTAAPSAVIHGEYYPENILWCDGKICPIDWESAAVAPGEIDLASLTERWSGKIVRRCLHEYQQARWPQGPPAGFERTLAAARLYLNLRWLGDRPEWTTHKADRWRFQQVRAAAEQLGLIKECST
jgi:hypothetical protein